MPPPTHVPQRMPQFSPGPNATSTPNAKGKGPAQPTGLHTPLQTPTLSRPPQGQNVGGMAQKTADRHAARLKAIEEAQAAQRREQEEAARAAAVAVAVPTTAAGSDGSSSTTESNPPRDHTPLVVPPPPAQTKRRALEHTESDEFHFPSDDDQFFANLDLDELDEGIERPIDFDEGKAAAEEMDVDVHATTHATATPPAVQPAANVQPVINTGAPRASVPHRQPYQPQKAAPAVEPPPSRSNARTQTSYPPHGQNALPQAASSSSLDRPRTPSMGGGFSFPTGVRRPASPFPAHRN